MTSIQRLPIEPVPYHVEMIAYLQGHEPDLWKWFSSDRLRSEQNEAARLDLLKCTLRIDRQTHEALYGLAEQALAKLGFSVPLTFYQSQDTGRMNVSLAYMPGEAHIVLMGPVATTLAEAELACVLGHELLHFALLDGWRDYLTASQLLAAMTNDVAAASSHVASARLFQLYTEVHCDRGSLLVGGDLASAVTALAKVETGVTDVSAESYLRQTEEIFANGSLLTQGVTHPEMFVRAKALTLWSQKAEGAAEEIARIIQGPLTFDGLDLIGQQRLSSLTRRLISRMLQPSWLRTDTVLAHAKLFFDDFEPVGNGDAALAGDLKTEDEKLRDYYCYLMLDFAAADRDLEEAPLAAAILLSEELGIADRFRQLAAKELNLRKKQLDAIEADARKIIARAAEEPEPA